MERLVLKLGRGDMHLFPASASKSWSCPFFFFFFPPAAPSPGDAIFYPAATRQAEASAFFKPRRTLPALLPLA